MVSDSKVRDARDTLNSGLEYWLGARKAMPQLGLRKP